MRAFPGRADVVVTIVAAIAVMAAAWVFSHASAQHAAAMDDIAQVQVQAASDLARAESRTALAEGGTVGEGIGAAKAAGKAVAAEQDGYLKLRRQLSSGEVSEDVYVEELKAHADALSKYRVDQSFRQAPWIDELGVDASWTFRFASGRADGKVDCTWTCDEVGGDGRMLAYSFATYDPVAGGFTDSEGHMTEYGRLNVTSTDDTGLPEPEPDDGEVMDEPDMDPNKL